MLVHAGGSGDVKPAHGPLHLVWLSLTASTGFPGPPTVNVTLNADSEHFGRVARLFPLPPPPLATAARPTKTRHPLTVCFPMNLTVALSNDKTIVYPSCYRPPSMQPLVRSLCPLLHKHGFCAAYRDELTHKRGRF